MIREPSPVTHHLFKIPAQELSGLEVSSILVRCIDASLVFDSRNEGPSILTNIASNRLRGMYPVTHLFISAVF